MKVLLAGGTGAIGRRLVPALLRRGHEVAVIGRSGDRLKRLAEGGAEAHSCDVFDASAVRRVVTSVAPDVVIDELTALPASMKPRQLKRIYARNDRVRWEGGGNVLAAAKETGVERLVVQSAAFWYDPAGPHVADESQPLFRHAPEPIGAAVRTMAAVEERAFDSGLEVVILRYGMFYGPGTWYSAEGDVGRQVRRRQFPLVGDGEGVFSFVHVDDAAGATALAVTGPAGVFNVVDDRPVALAEWLPAFAEAVGAPRPLRVPLWVARVAAGRAMVAWMRSLKGATNARARAELGWTPAFPSYEEGFRRGLAGETKAVRTRL